MSPRSTLIAALLAIGCASAPVHAQVPASARPATLPLALFTEHSPPYSMREGDRVIGIGTDMVREIMARSGIGFSVDLLPWKRAYAAAVERKDACVFSTTRTPEREPLFTWIGPIGEADWVLMGRADRNLKLQTLDDARPYRIGTYNGDARDAFLREHNFMVDPAPNDLINPRKLIAGRIDLWAASIRRGSLTLTRLGYVDKIVPVLIFNRIRVYLACNRDVPEAMVARMNASLEAMERDGTARAIVHRYDNWGMNEQR